jgi:hypothetical protein
MPPLTAPHIAAHLFEVGPYMAGGMGPTPLTFGEIDAWCNRTGIDLQPWECRFLRSLSSDYISELHRAEKWDAKSPWDAVRAQIVARDVKEYLKGLASL